MRKSTKKTIINYISMIETFLRHILTHSGQNLVLIPKPSNGIRLQEHNYFQSEPIIFKASQFYFK